MRRRARPKNLSLTPSLTTRLRESIEQEIWHGGAQMAALNSWAAWTIRSRFLGIESSQEKLNQQFQSTKQFNKFVSSLAAKRVAPSGSSPIIPSAHSQRFRRSN